MVQMNDVKMVYGNTEAAALNGISFTINEGEFVFLVGPSGSGKTTIIKLITGELSPTSGQIAVNGFDMQGIKRRKLPKLRRTLGVIFQDFRLIDKMTVYENVAFAMRVVGASNKEIRRRVPQVLELVGLADREKRFPAELSGGDQQRVAIARALVNNPRMIIADEPTPGMDLALAKQAMQDFRTFADDGNGVLLITHDLELALEVADRIVVFYAGTTVEEAKVTDFADETLLRHPYTRALYEALPGRGFAALPGTQPYVKDLPAGCPFAPRCADRREACDGEIPVVCVRGGRVRCILYTENS